MRFARPVQEFRKSCTFKDNFVLLDKPDLNMVYTWNFVMTPIASRKLKRGHISFNLMRQLYICYLLNLCSACPLSIVSTISVLGYCLYAV